MDSRLTELRDEAQALVAGLPRPAFYRDHASDVAQAKRLFFEHPLVDRLQQDCLPFLYDDYGHGIQHAKLVSVDAAAICVLELPDAAAAEIRRSALLAQFCGLLHDICRLEPDHARRGAETARLVLRDYPLDDAEVDAVTHAVAAHEAFTDVPPAPSPLAALLAGALYDADKFRWGPDNFSTTLWEICDYEDWSVAEIAERFPKGLETVRAVESTFRTPTGRAYGPEMIELGLAVGERMAELLARAAREPGGEGEIGRAHV